MKDWWKSGAPWIWLNGGAVTLSMIMVFGLLLLILVRGFGTFWPHGVFTTTYSLPGAEPVSVVGQLRRSETLTATALREARVPIPENACWSRATW
jgi:phosphate transport system permease protein